MQGRESYAEMQDWLYYGLMQIDDLPKNTRVDKARNGRARTLLRSIEAEHITIPRVCRDHTGIHIHFKFGQRSAEFIVGMTATTRVIKRSPAERFDTIAIHGWPAQVARDVLRWVVPICNHTTESGMIAAARERI